MAGDKVVVNVGRVRRGIADALQPVNFGNAAQQVGQIAFAAVFVLAVIGVDVLSEEIDFDAAGFDQPARFPQNRGNRAGIFDAARIGNDAVGAEVVAAFLNGQIGKSALRPVFGQRVEFGDGRKFGVDNADAAFARHPGQNFGQPVVSQRSGCKIDKGCAFGNFAVLCLHDTADDANNGIFSVFRAFLFDKVDAAEVGEDLFGSLFPNMAGVENNQVGRLGRRRLFVAQIFQNSGNAL